tara:strand:- start:6 stop:629 length:624 start_codon:yes stop_codon:yes gene_type:complete
MDNDIIKLKPNRDINKKSLNILWEGLAPGLSFFEEIADALNEIGQEIDINLHLITDLVSYKYFSKYLKINSSDRLKKYKLKINTYFYQWNNLVLSSLASVCDLAIIPISQNNKLVLGKPENKLILFWKLGLPVFTSYSKAYYETMKKANVEMVCMNREEWKNSIIKFNQLDIENRNLLSDKLQIYANNNYKKNNYIEKWNDLFVSII